MVTSPIRERWLPIVDVDVLDLDLALADGLRQEDMVQLLVLVVEDIGVALVGRDVRGDVGLGEHVVEGGENGASLDELVVIARDDEVNVRIEGEDGLDKCLQDVGVRIVRLV